MLRVDKGGRGRGEEGERKERKGEGRRGGARAGRREEAELRSTYLIEGEGEESFT